MRNFSLTSALGVTALCLTMAGTTRADIIDFTDGSWSTDNPQEVGGVSVGLFAFDDNGNATNFSETGFDGDFSQCAPLDLACDTDGIGIGDDEVSFGQGSKGDVERLQVSFDDPVDVASIIFLDLFGADSATDTPEEEAQIQVNVNGAGVVFSGTASDRTGFFVGTTSNTTLLSDPNAFIGVTSLEFFADTDKFASSSNTDFALAGIELVSVPEPGTLALLGLGLVGVGVARRRQAR